MHERDSEQIDALARSISQIIGALLVAGRQGQPAEGLLPFNPLYFHMLRTVARMQGCRPSHLADSLGVSRTTISTALKALQGRDLLVGSKDPSDGRAMVIQLTPAGEDVLAAIERQDRRNAQAMLDALPHDERDDFVRSLGCVARGLGSDEKQDGTP